MLETLYFKITTFLNNPFLLQTIFDNRFFLILIVIVLMRMKYATYRSMWLSALVNIPGTILHETMHFVIGLVMNAHPCNFTLWPKRDLNGNYVMGSVGFRNITMYNAVPAALAPLLLLPIGYYINRYILPIMPATLTNYILYVLLQTVLIENAMPSRADFHVAGLYFTGVIMYSVLFIALLLFL